MSCERFRELILDALADELDGDSAAELQRHVAACDACAAEADRMGGLWRDLGPAVAPTPRTDGMARLQAMIRRETAADGDRHAEGTDDADREPPHRDHRAASIWIPKAATVIVLVGLGAALTLGITALRPPFVAPEARAPDAAGSDRSGADAANDAAVPADDAATLDAASGGRYLLVMTRTNEAPEHVERLQQEMGAWIQGLQSQGAVESIFGLVDQPAVGAPPEGPIMQDRVAGLIILRAADSDTAARIAASCPSLRYGGSIEVRALN